MAIDIRQSIFHSITPKILCMVLGLVIVLQIILPMMLTVSYDSQEGKLSPGAQKQWTTHPTVSNQDIFKPIFGHYVPKNLNDNLIKKSLLGFKVVGIVLSNNPGESVAIIRAQGAQEKIYHQGDKLQGNVKIQQITGDEVLIEHEGELERLVMPKSQLSFLTLRSQKLSGFM